MSKSYGDGNLPRTRTGFGGRTEYISTNGNGPVWRTANGNIVEKHESLTGSRLYKDNTSETGSSHSSKSKTSISTSDTKHNVDETQRYQRDAYVDRKYDDFIKNTQGLVELKYRPACYFPHNGVASAKSHYIWQKMDYAIKSTYKGGTPIEVESYKEYDAPEILRKRKIDIGYYLVSGFFSRNIPRIYVDSSVYAKNNLIVLYATNPSDANKLDSTYTYFADTSTGKAYRIKNDTVPKDVVLKISDDGKGLIAMSEKEDKPFPWKECTLEENVEHTL